MVSFVLGELARKLDPVYQRSQLSIRIKNSHPRVLFVQYIYCIYCIYKHTYVYIHTYRYIDPR
jgi:hypothetical protein